MVLFQLGGIYMDNGNSIDKIIHEELLPLQQSFKSYEILAVNSSYRFDPKVFRKCAVKVQEVINIARELAK
jgi:hypothetical protein